MALEVSYHSATPGTYAYIKWKVEAQQFNIISLQVFITYNYNVSERCWSDSSGTEACLFKTSAVWRTESSLHCFKGEGSSLMMESKQTCLLWLTKSYQLAFEIRTLCGGKESKAADYTGMGGCPI